jgi:hypothetical protein
LREECRLKVFDNRVLRRIFGPKGDEGTGKLGELHNEELNNLYSHNIVRVMRRMRWAGNVARMEENIYIYTGFWWESLRERDHLEDPGVDVSIILRWIFRNWCGEH